VSATESCRAQLRVIAADLRDSLAEGLSPDQRAYAALVTDGELHPWTEQAEAIWVRATDPDLWRHHHLAVLHHAKAYDLESGQSPEALQHWSAALQHWSEVHADDAFWARMARHLSEHMGIEVRPDVVAKVRARLPRELLEPHRDLIAAYQASNPERARSHMRILKSAPFDRDLIDDLRLQFADDVMATIPDAVETADFKVMIAELRRWQHIDENNAHLLRSLLYAYRKFNEQVWDADDGVTLVAENIRQTEQLLKVIGAVPADPAGVARYVEQLRELRPAGLPQDVLPAEIARHEFWSGFVSERLADERFSWESSPGSRKECERNAARAVQHFNLARRLDSQLALDGYYSASPSLEASAESLWGLCLLSSRQYVGAAQHFRRATTLKPSVVRYWCELAQALLMPDTVSAAAVAEAEQAITEAAARVLQSGERKRLTELETLNRLLVARRAQNFGGLRSI
jgi:tetratricopeptide (TPR) repeat protein